MLEINCNKCGNELEEPGGLLFASPVNDKVKKYHLCKTCCGYIEDDLNRDIFKRGVTLEEGLEMMRKAGSPFVSVVEAFVELGRERDELKTQIQQLQSDLDKRNKALGQVSVLLEEMADHAFDEGKISTYAHDVCNQHIQLAQSLVNLDFAREEMKKVYK